MIIRPLLRSIQSTLLALSFLGAAGAMAADAKETKENKEKITRIVGPGPETPPQAAPPEGLRLAAKAQVVPTKPQPAFWTKDAKLLSYRCKNMKLEVRSRISPSTTFDLSSGMFNAKDCKSSVAALEKKGCFCDDADLKCIETEKIEPKGFACAGILFCFAWEGESVGVLRVKTLGNHVTRATCEKELADLDRE